MSQRAAAKVLAVSHQTIMRDVVQDGPKSGPKSATGSAATKAHLASPARE
jgi:hypothetical protein